jgi:DNA-directed RNA polymerase subunit RPC12/RpoP
MTSTKNDEWEVISKYSSEQATEDGILLDIAVLLLKPKDGIFSHITTNLLSKGYYKTSCGNGVTIDQAGKDNRCGNCKQFLEDFKAGRKLQCPNPNAINLPNIMDLLNQAVHIIKRKGVQDWFYSGQIELSSGMKQKVFLAQNETGKFTIMLPEDY